MIEPTMIFTPQRTLKRNQYYPPRRGDRSGRFTKIARRLNPIDLAAIPIGAYPPPSMMQFVHSTPEQALQIFSDLHADRFLAMYWGTFDLADEPVGEPPTRLRAESHRLGLDEKRIWVMQPGETRPW